ncbi:MAG: DEAD/DEAH box helicase family protein [Oscillospiraceae bacterium]|nr:DEAD/DEAH box helicase family protein [Oscillospiraceae bacterium]
MYELRPYQVEARDAVLSEWDHGHQRTLLVLPTGTGKTVVFASIIQNVINDGSRALVMAHRGELLTQAADKLHNAAGIESALEKAESSSLGSGMPVTVGSVQSLAQPKRLEQFPDDYFGTIVVDEAHHAISDTYQRVLEHFPAANVLGVTATPDRGDKRKLGTYFDSQAYEYSMARAIRERYLVPIKAQMIPLQLDLSDVGLSNGDYAAGEVGSALEPYLEQIAAEMARYCVGRKTVVFLPLIATSQKFCRMLNDAGLRACEVNGNSSDREEILRAFEAGEYDVLCNAMLLTEGWDCPAVDCIVVLRPTRVRSLYQQMVGRGMRLSPETGKDHLLLLDFLWMTDRHDLCRPSALVSKDAAIAEKLDEQLAKDDEPHDLIEAEEDAERDVLAEREAALARELAEMRRRKRKLVDPLQYSMSIAAEDLTGYVPTFAWEMAPPSEKQLAFLENRGIFAGDVNNAGMASMLIDRLISRQREGLTTPKQIRFLERYGFQHVGTWSFDHASRIISRIAARNWILPYGFDAAGYVPKEVANG